MKEEALTLIITRPQEHLDKELALRPGRVNDDVRHT
jgi:hypothetical protein